jgi:hypothetical protein
VVKGVRQLGTHLPAAGNLHVWGVSHACGHTNWRNSRRDARRAAVGHNYRCLFDRYSYEILLW